MLTTQTLDSKDLLTWCDDLHQVKGNVSQLQATLNQILSKAPTLDQFKQLALILDGPNSADPRSIGEKTKGLLNSPQLKVAMRLRHLYDLGKLPALLALSKINFKSPKADRFVGYFIDYTPPSDIGDGLPDVLKKNIKPSKQVDVETYPPSLPPIENESLMKKVLTDKSFRQPSDFIELASANDFSRAHNAKLAIKGRSLMELALYDILEQDFPEMHEEDVCILRYKLMSPSILTKLTLGYNLVEHYQFNFSDSILVQDKLQILAKIFLSYIAGLSLDKYSFDEICKWVHKLYKPIISELGAQNDTRPLNKFALSEIKFLFNQIDKASKSEISLTFEKVEEDPYVVKLSANGEGLGIGTSSVSEDQARERAATDAMSNKEKLDTVIMLFLKMHQFSKDTEAESDDVDEDNYLPRLEPSYGSSDAFIPSLYREGLAPQSGSVSSDGGNDGNSSLPYDSDTLLAPQPYGAPPGIPMKPQPYQVASYAVPDISKPPVDNNAKNNLYALLGSCHLTPTYHFQKTSNDFQAVVLVNDMPLGVGYDPNKKIASQKAAMNALNNTSALLLLGVYK